jgi:ribonuclease HII
MIVPDLKLTEEKLCLEKGFRLIAGVDEVGRGCLAGPVVAAAVILPPGRLPVWARRIRDSKFLTPEQREYLVPLIQRFAVSIGTGIVTVDYIDNYGMSRAVYLAMKRAIKKLSPQPDMVLLDYLTIPDLDLPQKGLSEGDSRCFSIACASIVAKVFRDHLMVEMDAKYPGYGFTRHKGYGTEEHLECLRRLGPSPIHRKLFAPVREWAQLSFSNLFELSGKR